MDARDTLALPAKGYALCTPMFNLEGLLSGENLSEYISRPFRDLCTRDV